MYIYWYDYFRADTDYKTSRRLKTNICDWYSFAKIKLYFIASVTQKSQISITVKTLNIRPIISQCLHHEVLPTYLRNLVIEGNIGIIS